MLLSGKSTDGLASAGPIVCACFGVGRNTICDAIAAGARTAAEIGAKLKAGTNCGSCIPELKRLIAQADANGAGKQAKLVAAELGISPAASLRAQRSDEAIAASRCTASRQDVWLAGPLCAADSAARSAHNDGAPCAIDGRDMFSMVRPFRHTDEPRK